MIRDSELRNQCEEFHRLIVDADHLPIDEIEAYCRVLRVLRALYEVIRASSPHTKEGARAKAIVELAMLALS